MNTIRTGSEGPSRGRSARLVLALAVLALALLLAGCGGSSEEEAPPEAAPIQEATPTQEPTATPTVSPLPTPAEQPLQVSPLPTDTSGSRGVKPVNVNDPEERIVERAVQRLAEFLAIDPSEVTVVSVEAVEWRDSSLGCPQPGRMYAQVITPGYKIVLQAQGQEYTFHTDSRPEGSMVLCQK